MTKNGINKFKAGNKVIMINPDYNGDEQWGKGEYEVLRVSERYVYLKWDSYLKLHPGCCLSSVDLEHGAAFYPESLQLISFQLMLFDI